jgi:hypothetical protein
MGEQIRFQKTGLGVLPSNKGANGDLLLEQRSGFGRREAARGGLALRAQELLSSGRTHGKQLAALLFI